MRPRLAKSNPADRRLGYAEPEAKNDSRLDARPYFPHEVIGQFRVAMPLALAPTGSRSAVANHPRSVPGIGVPANMDDAAPQATDSRVAVEVNSMGLSPWRRTIAKFKQESVRSDLPALVGDHPIPAAVKSEREQHACTRRIVMYVIEDESQALAVITRFGAPVSPEPLVVLAAQIQGFDLGCGGTISNLTHSASLTQPMGV